VIQLEKLIIQVRVNEGRPTVRERIAPIVLMAKEPRKLRRLTIAGDRPFA
jgi:hypothetical protein